MNKALSGIGSTHRTTRTTELVSIIKHHQTPTPSHSPFLALLHHLKEVLIPHHHHISGKVGLSEVKVPLVPAIHMLVIDNLADEVVVGDAAIVVMAHTSVRPPKKVPPTTNTQRVRHETAHHTRTAITVMVEDTVDAEAGEDEVAGEDHGSVDSRVLVPVGLILLLSSRA